MVKDGSVKKRSYSVLTQCPNLGHVHVIEKHHTGTELQS